MAKRSIDSLVADIASNVPVDWAGVDDNSASGKFASQFRIIATIGAGRPQGADLPRAVRIIKVILLVAVAVAALKVVLALSAALMAVPFRFGPRVLFTLLFGLAGAALFVMGRRDAGAVSLAGLFVLIASPFAQSYVLRARGGPLDWPAFVLSGLTPESFLALGLWFFAWTFPAPPRTRRAQKIGHAGLMVAAAVGVMLGSVNVLSEFSTFAQYPLLQSTLHALDRSADTLVFWPLLLLIGVLALPYLLWKSQAGTVDERVRASWLPIGILVSVAPIAIAAIADPFLPAGPVGFRQLASFALYAALASLIPSTAYVVLVKKVLKVHLVIRRAVQHALARQLVWAGIVVTLSYVAAGLYAGRREPLGALLSDQLGLMIVAAMGFLALTFRSQLLNGIDRLFRRGPADYSEVMARLGADIRGQRNLGEMHTTVTSELARTLDATRVIIVVVNEDGSAFVGLKEDVQPLPLPSAIAELFRARREPLCLAGDDADPQLTRLLPVEEQGWLRKLGIERLFPLRDSTDALLGLLCIGEARGSMFTNHDHSFVTVLSDQLALRMENMSLRHRPGDTQLDWENERAMQCPDCRAIAGAESVQCMSCESALEPAALPLVLNRKFEVQRVLGVGGMSVVYLALDTRLKRRVAIKAMPKVTPTHIARLEREAQAMAAVRHPSLALIYGVERWRDVPLLIVEYLDGGTLLDGLRNGPMPVDVALDLGIVLADALDRMHSSGLLHRDIKPSNIGYAADGLPKLLDFGLAAMLDSANDETVDPASLSASARTIHNGADEWSPAASRTSSQRLVGTPLYLSPEALAGDEPEPSFDLWSLSLVLYEAIAGRHPFAGYPADEVMRRTRSVRIPDVRHIYKDCPAVVAAFLNDALAISKEWRPASAAELRTQLQTIRHSFAPSQGPSRRTLY